MQHRLDDCADERQHDERGQKRPQPLETNQEAVDEPDGRPDRNGRRDRSRNRSFCNVGEGEIGADDEIDAADEHDADHDQTELADLPGNV